MLATVGAALAHANVNIAGLTLGREAPGEMALTVLATDEPVPPSTLKRIAEIEGVHEVLVVSV